MKNLGLFEIFLIQFIIYSILWLWDDYIGSLITVVMIPICFFLLIISLIAELIERSKVPKKYFYFMGISAMAPLVAALIFIFFMGADFEWMSLP